MTIYGEYFFLENFIAGVAFAYTTQLIAGRPSRMKSGVLRLIISGALAGTYAFIIFIDISPPILFISVAAFCLLQSLVLFSCPRQRRIRRISDKSGIKRIWGSALIYFLVTVLYGGMTGAILNLCGPRYNLKGFAGATVVGSGAIYLEPVTYLGVMAAGTVAAMTVSIAVKVFKEKRISRETRVTAEVSFDGKVWRLEGLIDTGNRLKDPITGKPVCLIGQELLDEMVGERENRDSRYVMIPYVTVGNRGILQGYRADSLQVSGRTIIHPIIAASYQNLGDVQILLPRELMERGIYGNH